MFRWPDRSEFEDQTEAEVRTSIWKPAWETVIINSLFTDHSRWKIGPAAESNIFSTLGGFAFNWVFQTNKIPITLRNSITQLVITSYFGKTVLNRNKLKRNHLQNQERFEIETREQMICTLLHYLYAGQIYAPSLQMNSLLLWYCRNRLSAMNPKKSDKVLRISKFEVFVCTTWLDIVYISHIDNRTLTEGLVYN